MTKGHPGKKRAVRFGTRLLATVVRCARAACIAAVLVATSSDVPAESCVPTISETLREPLGVNRSLGYRVDAELDRLLVSARYSGESVGNAGCVFVYQRTAEGLHLVETITPAGDFPNQLFGYDAQIEGEWIFAASIGLDQFNIAAASGYVDVFRKSGTTHIRIQTLIPPTTLPEDRYGYALAADNDLLIVGAPLMSSTATQSGAAYVFRRTGETWLLETRLDPVSSDTVGIGFGWAVATSGGRVFVGAPFDQLPLRQGAVHVFEKSNGFWQRTSRHVSPRSTEGPRFGAALAAKNDLMVVGAYNDWTIGPGVGAAYVYERAPNNTWSHTASLFPSVVPLNSFNFGWDVSARSDTIVVGANSFDLVATDSGGGFVFTRTSKGWEEIAIIAPESGMTAGLGHSVALDGDFACIGAPRDRPPTNSGSVTVVRLNPPLHGDADSDRVVGMKDIVAILAHFGSAYANDDGPGDSNHNGVVNFADATSTLANWGESCR